MLLVQIRRQNLKSFVVAAVIFQASVYLSIVHILNPHLNMFWISKNIETVINEEKNIENVYHSGFNEPSLVFLSIERQGAELRIWSKIYWIRILPHFKNRIRIELKNPDPDSQSYYLHIIKKLT